MASLPTNAITAVTLNCNSRCVMCDIWKNRMTNELEPSDYARLPSTLVDINVTGGEPFLRQDLHEIIAAMKHASPRARIVMSSNGFLPLVIERTMKKIIKIDPAIAVRFSLDGWREKHDEIRRIPDGFNKIMQSIAILRDMGVKDLGIGFTLMNNNVRELEKVFRYTREENLQLSLTIVTSSSIYFGEGKESLQPSSYEKVSESLTPIFQERRRSLQVKEWFRAWFEEQLMEYFRTRKRPFSCDAGDNFFYLDSHGNVFTCHMKNWPMGNLRKQRFEKIWNSKAAGKQREKVHDCNDCWMVCTAKSGMRRNLLPLSFSVLKRQLFPFS